MAENINPRKVVLDMLADTLEKGVFSHIVINDTFSKYAITGKERAFISRLYLGTIERLIYIDYVINYFSKTKTVKMKSVILNILRMSTYQLLFMDSVPDHAAINEAASLAKKRGFTQLVPFINAVLRNIQRSEKEYEENMPENVKLSVPKWFFEMVCETYGKEKAVSYFENSLSGRKKTTIRLNKVKEDPDKIIEMLEGEGCTVEEADKEALCFYLSGFNSLTALDSYKKGLFQVQDASSVRAALTGIAYHKMNTQICHNNALIVDVCAAPGGKSICAAQELPHSHIISRDLTDYKTNLIKENIKRLGINNIEVQTFDALTEDKKLLGKADLVIADLPCSGLGVIGGKPDIKIRVKQKDLAELAKLQRDILKVVSGYVKPGGILLYSTCTINKGENADNAEWFIEKYPFECLYQEQIFEGSGDGFYICVLKKKSVSD